MSTRQERIGVEDVKTSPLMTQVLFGSILICSDYVFEISLNDASGLAAATGQPWIT